MRPDAVGSERYRFIGRTKHLCIVVGLGVCPSENVLIEIGSGIARYRIGIVWIDLERLFEKSARRILSVLGGLYRI
jgi:hypothetical protein